MTGDLAGRVRAICLALPEATERLSHGAPTWFIRDKRAFVTLWAHGHHRDDFPHLWCAGLPGAQHELATSEPSRFFRPPYVGGRGWIGVRLDRDVDWAEIAELCQDAYRSHRPRPAGSSPRPLTSLGRGPGQGGRDPAQDLRIWAVGVLTVDTPSLRSERRLFAPVGTAARPRSVPGWRVVIIAAISERA